MAIGRKETSKGKGKGKMQDTRREKERASVSNPEAKNRESSLVYAFRCIEST